MKNSNYIEQQLKNIDRVEAPQYLYAKLQARIAIQAHEIISKPLAIAIVCTLISLCICNFVLLRPNSHKNNNISAAESFHQTYYSSNSFNYEQD